MWLTRNAQTDAPRVCIRSLHHPGRSPLFHQGQRSGSFGCTPGACLSQQEAISSVPFLLAGSSVYRYPWGTNINIAAAAERTSPSMSCLIPILTMHHPGRITVLLYLLKSIHNWTNRFNANFLLH